MCRRIKVFVFPSVYIYTPLTGGTTSAHAVYIHTRFPEVASQVAQWFPRTVPIYATCPSFTIHNTLFHSQKCPSLDIPL